MNRTTCEAGSTAYGLPAESVTTMPGRRCSASKRAASRAPESMLTTGKSSAMSSACMSAPSDRDDRTEPFGHAIDTESEIRRGARRHRRQSGHRNPFTSRAIDCRPDFPAHQHRTYSTTAVTPRPCQQGPARYRRGLWIEDSDGLTCRSACDAPPQRPPVVRSPRPALHPGAQRRIAGVRPAHR